MAIHHLLLSGYGRKLTVICGRRCLGGALLLLLLSEYTSVCWWDAGDLMHRKAGPTAYAELNICLTVQCCA